MSTIFVPIDSLVKFPISYGPQPVRGWRIKHFDTVVGGGTQRTLQQALGEAPWEALIKLWADAFEIPSTDYIFHNGLDSDAPDTNFPDDSAHPWTSYLSAKAKSGLTDSQTDALFGIYKTLRTPNYNGAGQQLNAAGAIITPSDFRTGYFYKPNPANCAIDQLLRWGKRLPSIVNFPAWVDWRDYNDELIAWDDAKYTPRSLSLTPASGGTLVPGTTYYIRVATIRGGDQSSASQKTIETLAHSITLIGGQTALQVSWLIKGDELQPAAPPGDITGYRVYVGTVPGIWIGYFTVANPLLRTLLITTTVGTTAGNPIDIATSGLLRNIKRFTCGKFFFPPYDLASALDQICQISCADWQWSGLGTGTYRNDKVRFLSPANRAPVFTFNLAETGMGSFTSSMTDRRSRYNQIVVNFRDEDDDFLQEAQPVILDRGQLQIDDGQVKTFTIDGGTMFRSQAQRCASFYARILCDQDNFSGIKGSPKSYHVLPADTILLTNDTPNWVDKKFVVRKKLEAIDKNLGDQLTLQEYVDGTYSDTDHSPLPAPLRRIVVVLPGAGIFTSTSIVGGHSANGDYVQSLKATYQFPAFTTALMNAKVYLTPPGGVEEDTGIILEPDTTGKAYVVLPAIRGKGDYTIRVLAQLAESNTPGTTSISTTLTITNQTVALANLTDCYYIAKGVGRETRYYWTCSDRYKVTVFEVYQKLVGGTDLNGPFTINAGNEFYSGGVPSNLMYRGPATEFTLNQDHPFNRPPSGADGPVVRSIDNMGNFSNWTILHDYLQFNSYSVTGNEVAAASALSADAVISSQKLVAVHIPTTNLPGSITATRIQIRQQGGAWPSSVDGSDQQIVRMGLHRDVLVPWLKGGTVEIRAMFDGSPDSPWSPTLTYLFPSPDGVPDTAYASLSAAVTAIGSTVTDLIISTPNFPDGADCTVPATLRLRFVGAGSLNQTHNVIILSDASTWPVRKIFTGSTAISLLGNKKIITLYPEWFGAVFDDATDDAPAIQSAIDSLGSTAATRNGPTILISGPAAIGNTILINRKSLVFSGNGWGRKGGAQASYLRWIGAAGIPMVRLQAVSGIFPRNLHFIGNAANKPSCALSFYQDTAVAITANSLENILIGDAVDGTQIGAQFVDGIRFEHSSYQNNAEWQGFNVKINGCTGSGIRGGSIQNADIMINGLSISGCQYGITNVAQISGTNWNFGGNTGADFYFPNLDDNAQQTFPIIKCNWFISEGSARLAVIESEGVLSLNGGSWGGTNLHTDHKVHTRNRNGDFTLRLIDFTWQQCPATAFIEMKAGSAGQAGLNSIILDGMRAWLSGGPQGTGLDAATLGTLDHKYIYFRNERNPGTPEFTPPPAAVNYLFGGSGQVFDPNRFDVPSKLGLVPSRNPQAISAAGNAITADAALKLISNTTGSSITLTSTPTIADGANGEVMVITNVGTDNIVLQDQGTLASSNLRLKSAGVRLGPRESVKLVFLTSVGDWVQANPVANQNLGTADAPTFAGVSITSILTANVSGIQLGRANGTLSNGANDNVTLPNNVSYLTLKGTTAAYSVSGFTNAADGRILIVYFDVSQTLTLKHNAGSSFGQRITLAGGVDITFAASAHVRCVFVYDASVDAGGGNVGFWVLFSAEDGVR